MRTLFSLLILLLLILPFEECKAQYQLSVPFNNGFVGDNTAQNVSSNSVYMSSLGWSNIQFAQNSTATTFVSQGNDIIGYVLITDNNGVEHSIPGFVKWRAPSGTVTSLIFSPSASITLATNGSNGSATYTISATKYVGLIFNGQTLSIPADKEVKGNAATTGLLQELNNYLAAFPFLTVPDYTVYESAGKILLTVSLSAVSTNTVSALYTSSDSTALSTSDYTSRSGSISFAPGELTKTVEIMITPDLIPEATEYFKVTFSDPKNASVQRGMSTITVLDDSPLGVDLISLNAVCEDAATRISWQTANEHSSDYFVVQGMNEFENWIELDEIDAAGESNELISYESFLQNNRSYKLFRLVQYDFNGAYTTHGPVALNCGDNRQEINVYPNPSNGIFSLSIDHTKGEETGSFSIVTLSGVTVFDQRITLNNGVNVFPIELNGFHPGIYYLLTTIDDKITSRQIVLQ